MAERACPRLIEVALPIREISAEIGAIILAGPEVDKLRQLAYRAWLYVVIDCAKPSPHLRTIQDPLAKLTRKCSTDRYNLW